MVIRWDNVLLAVAILVALVVMLRTCEDGRTVVYRDRVDTVTVQPPPVVIEPTPGTVRVIHDTVEIEAGQRPDIEGYLATIDSLNQRLSERNVRRTFSLDSVTARGDTVHVVCNETDKTVSVDLRMAPVSEVRIVTDTLVLQEHSTRATFQPYVQAGAVMDQRSQWGAQGNAGVRLQIGTSEVVPFAEGLFNTLTGAQVRLGVEVLL